MTNLTFDHIPKAALSKDLEGMEGECFRIRRGSSSVIDPALMGGEPLMKALFPFSRSLTADSTAAPGSVGVLEHPIDMALANRMTTLSTYHGSCQRTLVSFTCGRGIGIIDEEATETKAKQQVDMGEVDSASMLPSIDEAATKEFYLHFNKICEHGFNHVVRQMVTNFWGVGNGYLELARAPEARSVAGLWWVPGQQVWKYQLDGLDSGAYCWKYNPFDSYNHSAAGMMYLRRHMSDGSEIAKAGLSEGEMSPNELLDFQLATTNWRHYGGPQWLAAVPPIEVDWKALQRVSDYMHNNGVPETIVVIGGVKLTPQQSSTLQAALSAGGGENYGKGALLNLPTGMKDRMVFEVHKIGQSLEGSGWADTHSAVNLSVASANQVPPILAGITVPGKMGASNEQVLAMVLLQHTVVSPQQDYIAERMSDCLLGRACGGPAGLVGRRLRFRTMLESSDIVALNTVARQREQVTEDPKRDPKDGLKRG